MPDPLSTPPVVDPALLASVSGSLSSLQGTVAEDQAQATAQATVAAGDTAEAQAYGNAIAIANANADIETQIGNLEVFQQQREVAKTVGGQEADIAGSGFTESGTAVDLMRDSYQKGYLGAQLIGMQSELTRGGFLEQGAAAQAESAAATAAASEAAALSASYATAGQTAQANLVSGTNDLLNYLNTIAPGNTGDQQLIKDIQSGNTAAVELDVKKLTSPTSPASGLNPFSALGAGGTGTLGSPGSGSLMTPGMVSVFPVPGWVFSPISGGWIAPGTPITNGGDASGVGNPFSLNPGNTGLESLLTPQAATGLINAGNQP